MKKFMRTPNHSGMATANGPRLRPAIAANGQAPTNGNGHSHNGNGHSHNGNGHMYSQNGHANGHGGPYQMKAAKLNGHANGAANGRAWTNGFVGKPEDKQSTLSRYWTTERARDGSCYQSVRRACSEAGVLWEDPDFPAGPKALYKHRKPPLQPIVWMRPHEMCTRPLFRGDAADGGAGESGAPEGLAGRFSVEPGELGDPHLLAAAAALAFTPRLLDRVVPPDQDFDHNYCGMFRFRFWHFGEWKEVLVDDRLPTYRGRLLHLHSANCTEFWAALLEKAYAKLYGNYESLQAGNTTRSLQDLTGGIVQSFGLSHQDRYLTFQVLNSAVPRSSLLVATISPEKDKRQLRLRNGLITAQAYSVTGLARVRGAAGGGGGDTPLVRLRNPTGRGEWAGAWSRASWEWHGLSERDKELLSVRVTNDGEFWMSFEDFARVFTCLELVHVGPDDWMSEAALHAKRPWRAVLARRRWRAGYNAGGGPQYLETTAMNPQFHVQIPRATATKCHVVVSVTQYYETRPPSKKGLIAIGFAVYEVPPAMPRLTMHYVAEQKPLDVTNHSVAREVVTFFTLPPGDYVVVPQTSAPNVDAKFLLRILTDEQSNIWEVNEDNMVIRNISTEFLEDRQLIPAEVRATLARLLGKRPIEEVDAAWLRAALRRCWRSCLAARPSLELCRSLVMLRDTNISGRIPARDIPPLIQVDAARLRAALRRCWRSCLAARPSLELCRSLVMLRDTNISGRIPARDIPPLIQVLQFWKHVFQKYTGSACASKTSSYNLRALLWAAGVTASNKVLECLVLRFAKERVLTAEAYVMAMVRLHLAHERYHNLDTKMKSNPLSLEEMILMTIYS